MKFDPDMHHRRSIRVPGYDYSQAGAYFVTIVAHERQCIFGEIQAEGMMLSLLGSEAQAAWFELPVHYEHLELGEFCIMPNHFHAIVILRDEAYEGGSETQGGSQTRPYGLRHPLSEIIRAFKSFSARRINELRGTPGVPVWQRNYYEHIIRDDEDYMRISYYIEANIENWLMDEENPAK